MLKLIIKMKTFKHIDGIVEDFCNLAGGRFLKHNAKGTKHQKKQKQKPRRRGEKLHFLNT